MAEYVDVLPTLLDVAGADSSAISTVAQTQPGAPASMAGAFFRFCLVERKTTKGTFLAYTRPVALFRVVSAIRFARSAQRTTSTSETSSRMEGSGTSSPSRKADSSRRGSRLH
jgi:hypothetical protein